MKKSLCKRIIRIKKMTSPLRSDPAALSLRKLRSGHITFYIKVKPKRPVIVFV